jgi:short-subunit dehydrogenase
LSNIKPVVLITGASSGIGAELARVFIANGHEVMLVARRARELQALADAVAGTGRPRPHVLPLDLAQPDAPDRITDELRNCGLEPAFVVNNAGFGLLGPAADLDRERQLAMTDLNVRTLTDLSLRFIDSLERHRGGILNVSSVAGFLPGPGMAVYHATKAYILLFSEALHQELKRKGVRVTVLCPGPVATEFQARAGMTQDYYPRLLQRTAARVAQEGYDGLMKGQCIVVPAFNNKVLSLLPRLLPRGIVLRLFRSRQPL